MVSLLQTLVGSIIVTLELWLVTSMEMENGTPHKRYQSI